MAKSFMGVRLRSLREERGITQAALAQALKLSPSYVNQIESNQRPLTVPVLLRLQAYFGHRPAVLLGGRGIARARRAARDHGRRRRARGAVPLAELQSVAQQLPAFAKVLMALHRALPERRGSRRQPRRGHATATASRPTHGMPAQPHEEVREFFYARHNHMAVLDERAEALYERLLACARRAQRERSSGEARRATAAPPCQRALSLLRDEHGVRTAFASPTTPATARSIRASTPARRLRIAPTIEPGQRAFQLGDPGRAADSRAR